MKKLRPLFVVIVSAGILITALSTSSSASWKQNLSSKAYKLLYYSPCDTPIEYKIGTIDSRFNISQTTFAADVKQAGNVWSKLEGKDLFEENSNGNLSINMVYDERQTLINQTNKLENTLNQEKQNTLNPQIQQYEADSTALKSKFAALNAQIQTWNAQGGAPQDIYNQLIAQQNDLKTQADNLKTEAAKLNLTADNYNAQVDQLNQTVSNFNALLQVKPEEGLYTPEQDRIDIYFDNTQNEFIHTLTHEMGHSLGLEHNQNPKSIMYPYSTEYIVPSADDKAALDAICKEQSLIERAHNYLLNYKLKVQTLISMYQK